MTRQLFNKKQVLKRKRIEMGKKLPQLRGSDEWEAIMPRSLLPGT